MLTRELAHEIVKETMERLNRNINIMDTDGVIIASGDPERIGQRHEAAAEAVRLNRELIVDRHSSRRWRGTQQGINLPIHENGQAVGAIGITGDPQEVSAFGHLVKMTTELMIRQNQIKLQSEWKQMTADWIMEELLHSAKPDLPLIERRLMSLGLRLVPPYRVAAAAYRPSHEEPSFESLLAKATRTFAPDYVLMSQAGPQKLLILLPEAGQGRAGRFISRLSALLLSETGHYRIGISSPIADKAQLRIGSQEAELALRYGEAEQQEIVYFEAVETRALLHEIPEAHRQRLLDKLAACRSGKARETLTCFFECSLSIAPAAKKLEIHRNTMIYRLEQIKALTGYDPQHFHDALVLQLALWLEPTERGSG